MWSILNLTKNELNILEILYSYGVLTTFEISEYTKLGKNTVLYILKRLEEKNLVQKRTRNNTFLFQARSPDILLEQYNDKMAFLKEKGKELAKYIYHLKDVQNYESLKKISYYDDEKSIKRLRASLIDAVQTGRMKRNLPNEYGVEIFENEYAIYIMNVKKCIAVKIQPTEDFLKLKELFEQTNYEK